MKKVIAPTLVFILSALLTLLFIQVGLISFIVGASATSIAHFRTRGHDPSQATQQSYVSLYRSGIALMAAPVIAALAVVAGMSGIFS